MKTLIISLLLSYIPIINSKPIEVKLKPLEPIKRLKKRVKSIDTLCFKKWSYYQPKANQTDNSPLYCGSGKYIDTLKLKKGLIKWVAVSPDLLKRFGGKYRYGDTIFIKEPIKYRGKWVVNDCMNKKYTNKVDFLVW